MLKKIKDIMGKKDKTNAGDNEKLQEETLTRGGNHTETADNQADSPENEAGETDEIEDLRNEVAEQKDKNLRLRAEFDNFRRRTMQEMLLKKATAAQDTLAALLPVLDDFDRAKKIAEDDSSTEQFSEGVTLVYNKLQSILEKLGLEAMESTGEVFDPEYHEAITEIPAPSEEMKGKIIDTIETGYFLKEKIIRHAKVVVGK